MHIDSIMLFERAIKANNKTKHQLNLKFLEEIGELARAINKKEGIERVFEESVDCFIVFCQYYTCESISKLLCTIHMNKQKPLRMSCEDLCFWYQSKLGIGHPTRETIYEVYNCLKEVGPFDTVFEEKVRKFYRQVI